MTEPKWYAIEVTASAANREAIEYGLMEAGAAGTETVDTKSQFRVTGYFEGRVDEQRVLSALVDACRLYNHASVNVNDFRQHVRPVPQRDWLAEWKKSWQPVQVGSFIIAPPWLVSLDAVSKAQQSDAIIIRINPGMAFGTGTHETTRLCLKAIDKYFHAGSFLDVGTGTGVLAIAAARRQQTNGDGKPGLIHAYDTDSDAIDIARENARLNGVADRIDFQVGSIDPQTPAADFVCANLTAPVIGELLPALVGAACGRLVLSGILVEQLEMIRLRLAQFGVANFEIARDGEWMAVVI